ncbi:PREDICTED: protein ELYS [Polistes canadensis]|uniref:protein ELYS n=1 Tax=Polistes canadensis TaxID=91411 RepID=UPI000718EC19|nr:PREDICTED: protein ELYS [Polistes canadensis]
MKELEEVNCEALRESDLRKLISDRLKNSEDEYGSSVHIQDYDATNNFLGGFLHGTTYAWMSNDCHLIVFNVKFGENINCCWTFSEKITCVSEFPTKPGHLPLLLVGLDNGANKMKDSFGLLCIFDCNTSRVLRAIRTPTGIERVCVVSGGTEWEEINDKRTDNIFSNMDGIACVVLRNLQHIMIDLQRSSWDDQNSITCMDETLPAELDFSFEKNSDRNLSVKEKHMAYNLFNNNIEKCIGFNRIEFESYPLVQENLTSMIIYSTKIGCIISGCLGRIMIWQNNGSIAWISRPLEENMTITHLSLLEPTDDPRPFYYLWVVYEDETLKMPPILRMYALLFERKYCEKGTNLYFNLEAEPCLRFEFELEKEDKIISLSPIEREVNPDQTDSNIKRGEDNLLLIASNDRLLLFDLNQWYKEQMPQTIYDCKNPNSILATYCTSYKTQSAGDKLLSSSYIPSTLREFPTNRPCPAEELFYPNSLSFEWAELSTMRLITWLTRGIQTELLRKMAITGPVILLQPKELFHKCLSVGLVPFNTELSFLDDENTQRETLLSLCLEQRWTSFLVKCAMEWSDGSASFLYPSFVKWGVQRASSIKLMADHLCIPLFDQSDSSIGEAEIKTLRFCSQQLECLSNVVGKLILETDEMIKQRRALRRVSIYLQVLLWFYDVGLLPEIQELDEERQLPLSLSFRIPYPYEKLMSIYAQKRDAIKNNKNYVQEDEGLFIDMLINKECPILKSQWEREGGDVNVSGYYPPPSLQSLLRSYLADCYQADINETECKHQIAIYLLMDLVMLLHGSYPGVDQLIKYPSAFKMSPSLIKLTQAFWLLDHEDYKGFLDMMTGQLVSDSDVKSWHHKHVLRTLVRNDQQKLALVYLRIRKPPISCTSDQSALVNLSVQHGLIQSAFHCRPPSHYAQLLTCFFEACKSYNKLGDILHLALEPEEEEIFVKFLQEDRSEDMKTLYYLQRCRYSELNNKTLLSQFKNNVPKNMLSTSAAMLKAYDSTLPSVIKHLSSSITKTTFETDLEPKYPRPMSHYKCINKQQSIYETVIKKAKETSFQSGKCRIPFITAPCASLKANVSNINISCVLFPAIAYKNRKKRTLDEIYENDNNESLEETKRRKLSNNTDTANTSCPTNLSVTFDTPLVKRKSNVANNKNTCIGTPHSILKIRQLIQNSASPNISITQSVETNIPDPPLEKQKKINRQIRFSINSPVNNISHESVIEEQIEEIEENVSEEISLKKSDTLEKDTELFLSPNTSDELHNETTQLLSDDSFNDKSNCYPRPRPRLRRSYLTGKNTMNTTATNSSTTSPNLLNTSKDAPTHSTEMNKQTLSSSRLHSSLSATMYSTMILSPTSSIDENTSLKEAEKSYSLNQLSSPNISYNYKNAISSTPLVKTKPIKLLDDNNEELMFSHEEEKPTESFNRNERMEISNDYDTTSIKDSTLKEIDEDSCNEESEHEYKSLPNSPERELNTIDSKVKNDSIGENNKSSNGLLSQKLSNVVNVVNDFDITDDESSNDDSKIKLIYETSPLEDDNKDNIDSETDRPTNINPQPVLHFSDVSNITEDGSNNSNDIKEYNNKKEIRGEKDNVTVKTNKRNLKQIVKINELKHVEDSSNDSISNELSSQQVITLRDMSEIKVQKENNITSCTVKLNKISTESKETTILEEGISSRMTTRSKRINSSTVKKETISVKSVDEYTSKDILDDSENISTTSMTRRTRRSSSLAKDIFPITKIDKESDETVNDNELTRRVTRRASSVQKELTHVSTPRSKRTRSTSISKTTDETSANLSTSKLTGRKIFKKEEEDEKVEEVEKEKETPVRGRLTRSSSTSLITKSNKEQEILTDVQPKRRRGNSVPKESTIKMTQKEKSSNVIPDIPEGSLTPTLQSRRRKNSMSSKIVEDISNSPAANTRSRRSSIQPIPEEMEMILNSPQNLSEINETLSNTRTRRATSVDSSSLDVKKRTRGIRKPSIIGDAILEESMETESQMDSKVTKNTRVKSSKRKRTLSCN